MQFLQNITTFSLSPTLCMHQQVLPGRLIYWNLWSISIEKAMRRSKFMNRMTCCQKKWTNFYSWFLKFNQHDIISHNEVYTSKYFVWSRNRTRLILLHCTGILKYIYHLGIYEKPKLNFQIQVVIIRLFKLDWL